MYVTSPEQRHEMWDDAVAHRGGERRTRLHYIALDIHAELSALHLYTDYREPLIEAVQTLDAADRFLDHSMLMAYPSRSSWPYAHVQASSPSSGVRQCKSRRSRSTSRCLSSPRGTA